jgi:hypothetical protein
MTFLEMYKVVAQETIQPTVPTTVIGQTGMNKKLVDWIIASHEKICSLWTDWNFLVTEHSVNTVADTATITKPADLGVWDKDSFYLDRTTATYKKLKFMDYGRWRTSFRNGVKVSAKPTFFTIEPDKDIILEAPPDDVYALTADYWQIHDALALDADTSLIPAHFQRVIIARAKMYFFADQEIGSLYQESEIEYNEVLKLLEADQLPGRQSDATGSNDDLVVVPE